MRFHSMANLLFYLKNDLFIKKMTWSRHFFFVLFLKGKQNKKENPKCDFYLENMVCEKPDRGSGVRGQVTYREGTIKTVAPL